MEDLGRSLTGRAVVNGATSVPAVPASIPSAIAEQACLISKNRSTVTIECDDAGGANELFDWLTGL